MIIGALSALLVLLAIVVAVVIVRHRRNKYGGSNPLKMFVGSEHINFNLNDLSGTGVSVGTGEKVREVFGSFLAIEIYRPVFTTLFLLFTF